MRERGRPVRHLRPCRGPRGPAACVIAASPVGLTICAGAGVPAEWQESGWPGETRRNMNAESCRPAVNSVAANNTVAGRPVADIALNAVAWVWLTPFGAISMRERTARIQFHACRAGIGSRSPASARVVEAEPSFDGQLENGVGP